MIKLIRIIIGLSVLVIMYQVQKPLWDAGVYSGEYWSDVESDYDEDDYDDEDDDDYAYDDYDYAYDDYDTESDW